MAAGGRRAQCGRVPRARPRTQGRCLDLTIPGWRLRFQGVQQLLGGQSHLLYRFVEGRFVGF